MKNTVSTLVMLIISTTFAINSFAGMNSPLEHLPTNSFIRITKDLLIETGVNEIDLGWTFGKAEEPESKCSMQVRSNHQYDRVLEKGELFKVEAVEWLASDPVDMELKITLVGMPHGDYILFRWDEETDYKAKIKDLHDRCDNLFKIILPAARSYRNGKKVKR